MAGITFPRQIRPDENERRIVGALHNVMHLFGQVGTTALITKGLLDPYLIP
jgi:hypothetical protein